MKLYVSQIFITSMRIYLLCDLKRDRNESKLTLASRSRSISLPGYRWSVTSSAPDLRFQASGIPGLPFCTRSRTNGVPRDCAEAVPVLAPSTTTPSCRSARGFAGDHSCRAWFQALPRDNWNSNLRTWSWACAAVCRRPPSTVTAYFAPSRAPRRSCTCCGASQRRCPPIRCRSPGAPAALARCVGGTFWGWRCSPTGRPWASRTLLHRPLTNSLSSNCRILAPALPAMTAFLQHPENSIFTCMNPTADSDRWWI